jgi:hypothetical protein
MTTGKMPTLFGDVSQTARASNNQHTRVIFGAKGGALWNYITEKWLPQEQSDKKRSRLRSPCVHSAQYQKSSNMSLERQVRLKVRILNIFHLQKSLFLFYFEILHGLNFMILLGF